MSSGYFGPYSFPWGYPYVGYPFGLIAAASNVVTGTNQAYTKADFLAFYGQFEDLVTDDILNMYIALAQECVIQARWHAQWKFGMANFIAHFLTLYLQVSSGNNPTASSVVAAAMPKGLPTSKSVGDVSVSYDFSNIDKDLDGWAMFKATQFGRLFADTGRLVCKGPMYVY